MVARDFIISRRERIEEPEEESSIRWIKRREKEKREKEGKRSLFNRGYIIRKLGGSSIKFRMAGVLQRIRWPR